jgi:hypothetical protein
MTKLVVDFRNFSKAPKKGHKFGSIEKTLLFGKQLTKTGVTTRSRLTPYINERTENNCNIRE